MGISDNIKIKLGAEKDCLQNVTVEVPNSIVKEKIEAAFKSVQSQAKLPGFRSGKTPLDVVKKNFKDTAYAQAQDRLMREGVAEAIQSKNLQAVQTPVIQTVKFDPEKSFQFEFQVEVAPSFKVSHYKGIKVKLKEKKISDQDVDKRLNEIADGNSKFTESKSEALESKHFANINYEGFIDDKPMEGTKVENFLMDLSAPQSISGLSEGLLGAKAGGKNAMCRLSFPKILPLKH